jgi:fructosamine-3-kinase
MAKRGGGMPKGFVSKAQWRYFFANKRLRKYAKKEAHKAQARGGGIKVAYRGLPTRKGARKR